MANEITMSASLVCSKGGANVRGNASGRLTMAGDDMIQDTQVIGTSAEAVTWGEISGAPAAVFIKNMDDTNFVLVGFTNPPTEIKLLSGQFALFPPATATIYAKADTADVRIWKVAAEA